MESSHACAVPASDCRERRLVAIFTSKAKIDWKPQLRDPSDEMVLEAAVNAQAQAIVTYNLKDFFAAHRFGLQLTTPQQALQAFNLTHFRSIQP